MGTQAESCIKVPEAPVGLWVKPRPADLAVLSSIPGSHTCDISRFRRELPIWSLFSRSHSRETKSPDERFSNVFFSDRISVRTFYRLRQ